jgi:hypothetical protein
MADLLRREDVRELIENPATPAVSIFLPTHRIRGEREQDPIRFRNLLDQAEERLVGEGARPADVRSLLAPGRELLDSAIFWSYQSDGLAAFLAPDHSRFFRLPLQLPELVVVGDRFHMKPLLDLLTNDHRFFVLALSQDDVRLLEASRHDVQLVDLGDVPTTFAEVLKYDDVEREQNLHVSTRGGLGARAVFHGHGGNAEDDKVLIERWLRSVDDAVMQVLAGQDAPLVLAGVGYERALYRSGTRYKRVLNDGIDGNPEMLSPEELHKRAWELVEPVVAEARAAAAGRFQEAAGKGTLAASRVQDIVPAALQGRVETLFVPVGVQIWGTVDPQTFEAELHHRREPGDEDLLDRAAVATLFSSGTVYSVPQEEIPPPGPAAAVFRY